MPGVNTILISARQEWLCCTIYADSFQTVRSDPWRLVAAQLEPRLVTALRSAAGTECSGCAVWRRLGMSPVGAGCGRAAGHHVLV